MPKLYWFKNKVGEIIDASEKNADNYLRRKRYEYVGCSDGSFLIEARKQIAKTSKDENGIIVIPNEETRKLLLEAQELEIELAKENKELPREFNKLNPDGNILNNPQLRGWNPSG